MCCRKFAVLLTPEEARSGFYRIDWHGWIPGARAAMLAKKKNGDCWYLTEDGRCSIYENRPQVCREFDCEKDERVKAVV